MLLVIDLNKAPPAECVLIVSQPVSGATIEMTTVPINDNVEVEDLGTPVNPNAKEV